MKKTSKKPGIQYKPLRIAPTLYPKRKKYAPPSETLTKLQARLAFLRETIEVQKSIGNEDTASYFDKIAIECENLIFDVSALLIENPAVTETEIRKMLLDNAAQTP